MRRLGDKTPPVFFTYGLLSEDYADMPIGDRFQKFLSEARLASSTVVVISSVLIWRWSRVVAGAVAVNVVIKVRV